MNKNKKFEHLANGFHAAGKINNMRRSNLRGDSSNSFSSSNITVLSEMLQTIAEYSPDSHRGSLEGTIYKSNEYINTYRNLKNHFRSVSNQKINTESFVRTLDLVKPVVNNNQQVLIEKILKVYEIIRS